MILEFADNRINEYATTGFHKKNERKPFEVAELLGQDLLLEMTKLDGRSVPIFKRFEKKVSKSFLPEDFPFRAELEANSIFTLEDVKNLTLESHADLTGIGKKSMQKILDAAALAEAPTVPDVEEISAEKGEGE